MSSLMPDEVPVLCMKHEIAQVQLVEAINFFLAEKYIPCITLAGAAEEIFGRLLNNNGKSSIVEISAEHIEDVDKKTGLNLMGGRPKKEIFKLWNTARNSLKHHGKFEPETFEMHPFNDAYMMIRRALFNAKSLGVKIENSQDFENWLVADGLKPN